LTSKTGADRGTRGAARPHDGLQKGGVVATYPIDIELEQIVRWLVAEQKATPSLFRFAARRASEVREVPPRLEYRLGDEEREDLSEVDTITTLEVDPAHASEGCYRLPSRTRLAPVRPTRRRGIATATAEVRDAADERHLREPLDAILVDRHPL
jgi:hypothetical protein